MAFVRWRGNCAQLLTTITVDGRPRHRLLVNLHGGFATTPTLWAQIARDFPTVTVDWAVVDRALAAGPPSAVPPTPLQRSWSDTAHQLRVWATDCPFGDRRDREILRDAADILTQWQSSR